jgi:hypothetical protein
VWALASSLAFGQALQSETAHERRHGLAIGDDLIAEAQLGCDAPGAVGAHRRFVDVGDQCAELLVAKLTDRRRFATPVVEARRRHAEHPAELLEAVSLPGQGASITG